MYIGQTCMHPNATSNALSYNKKYVDSPFTNMMLSFTNNHTPLHGPTAYSEEEEEVENTHAS
jgi:hypothetical protein